MAGPGRFLPLIIFLALAWAFVYTLLLKDPQTLPSAQLQQVAPQLSARTLSGGEIKLQEFGVGEVLVVNFFASWCPPCRVEHPALMDLAESGVRVIGVAYKDEPVKTRRFLKKLGNPFDEIALDTEGRIGIDWGITGVPETFILDSKGYITYRHQTINPGDMDRFILPELEKAQQR